jgi:hypothetical protein
LATSEVSTSAGHSKPNPFWKKLFALLTPIEFAAVDLNQKAGGVRYSIGASARSKSAGSSSLALWRS